MRKSWFLLTLFIILSLGLSACTDQPPVPSQFPPRDTVPPPSTPGPPTQDDNNYSQYVAGTGTGLSTPTPAPTPARPVVPAPLLSGAFPNLLNLPPFSANPVTARQVAQYLNQGKTEQGQPEPLRALAFSPDGKWLALADRYQIWVVEAASGKLLQLLYASNVNTDDWGANSLAWSPDGTMLAVGGLGGVTTMWRWDKSANNFRKGPSRLLASAANETFGNTVEVAFSPDSKLLAAFGSDGHINLFNTATTQLQATFFSDYAGYISWAPDGKRLADEFLIMHYLNTGQSIWPDDTLAVASDGPQGVAWSPDGKLLAVSADGFELALVEAPTPDPGAKLLNPAVSRLVKRVNLRPGPAKLTSMPHLKEGRRVVWAPSGRWIAVANVPEAGKISLWNRTGDQLLTIDAGSEVLRALVWPYDNLLISAGEDGKARVWQLDPPPATTKP